MSKCPTEKQNAVIDYLSEKVIALMPCDQGGAGKKKIKRKSKKQRGGVTRNQVKTFLKRVMNIGITCLVIFCIVTGPWENLVRELEEGYTLWTTGDCHSMGQRFFNAFAAGNRFCAVATGLERDAWNFLMNDPTGRSTLFGIVSSVMGVAGAYASYHSLANRIADGVARLVGTVPAVESGMGMDMATRQEIDALAARLQEQINTSVDATVERVLANPQMYARIVGMMGSGSAAASATGSSYTVDEDQDSQDTLSSDPPSNPDDLGRGGKRRKTKKRNKKRGNKSRKRMGKSKKRNRK
jgi:hypothetical protein